MTLVRWTWLALPWIAGCIVAACASEGNTTGGTPGTGGSGGTSEAGLGGGAGTGGAVSTGGAAGVANGGSAGAATGGSAGAATGGSAGTSTGGSAGNPAGGAAGTATGGSAGTGTGGSAGGSNQCTLVTGMAGCDQCINTNCLSLCQTCSANPECVALVYCAVLCQPSDQACIGACGTAHPNGVADALPLAGTGGCVPLNCASQCGQSTGACAIQFANPPCDNCVQANCLSQCQACAGDTECVALVQCGMLCAPGDQTCINTCTAAHPNGMATALPFVGPNTGCVATNCATQCPM